jgi:hypothetical protein
MLLTKTMKVVRHASMSKVGYEKALDTLDELVQVLSRIEPDIGCDDRDDYSDCYENQVRVNVGGLHLPKVLKNMANMFSKYNIYTGTFGLGMKLYTI